MADLGTKGSDVKEVSEKKTGFRDIVTPFKDITNDHGGSIAPGNKPSPFKSQLF